MRNLKLKYSQHYTSGVVGAKFLLINPNLTQTNEVRYVVTNDKLFSIRPASLDEPTLLAEVPDIVSAEFMALDNEICLATGVGEVLLINPETKNTTEGTFCDVGIECMSWSPDQEVVVFITKAHDVVVMTCTFDPLMEHSLKDAEAEIEGQFVNVGWGKKETQFHGSEGKQAAKRKEDAMVKLSLDDLPKNIEISWRADGVYFVVSYVCATSGRTFKVFDREGKLQYACEKQANLYPATAWRPSGTWIAVPQLLPNKSVMALFEKNGLRHREFQLPFDLCEQPIRELKWSSDSEILSILAGSKLYLYTIGNYHWYLKQVLDFESASNVVFFEWDNRIGEEKTLHILLESSEYLIYKWTWAVDRFNLSGLVAVIDGKRLLLTNFSMAVIPPPMSSGQIVLETDAFICSIALTGAQDDIQLCLYDSQHNFHMYKARMSAPCSFIKLACLKQQPLQSALDLMPLQYGNVQWFESFEDSYLMAASTRNNMSQLYFFAMDNPESSYKLTSSISIKGTINALCPSGREQPCELFFQTLEDNKLTQLVYDADSKRETSRRLHSTAMKVSIDNFETFIGLQETETYTIALAANRCLFVNSQEIASDVSSFCMAGNYLAFTKLASLHFLRLSDMKLVDERRLERGAKLVTTIYQSARTVLQMPRGNLEAISPRVLSLELVGALLEQQRYSMAFDMLRKQRINLNIICDHNMCDFLNRLDVFLGQITNPNWLNLFLSDLQNEDFTTTMYASNYKEGSQQYPADFKIENKIAYVCKALCARMELSSEKRYHLPILTAYVKLGELEKALLLIWERKKQENENMANEGAGAAEEALKYLLYLVDVNELYNVALGTYDFGLVLFVAQKSQKDPKEFLAFLNELKAYELNYRKYKIDEHLKRYEKALRNIAQCGKEKFDEALAFIKKHAYYAQALRAYEEDEQSYREICLAFADYLRSNNKLENASIMYERGGNLQQALLSAKNVLDWQRALMLAAQSQQDLKQVAQSLVSPLQEQAKYDDAFELLKLYGDNFQEALESLTKGKLFLKAIYESNIHQKDELDLTKSFVQPKLLDYIDLLGSTLTSDADIFKQHKQRLLEVRIKKAKKALMDDADCNQMEIDECDLISDTTSMNSSRYSNSSRGTGKTFRSSKNRRKHERKLLSLKPGNPFEDIALIDALYNQIQRIFLQQQHIRDTCKALLLVQQDTVASELQHKYKSLLVLIKDSLDDIWIPEMLTTQQFLQGPNIDYTQLQNEQRYAMISPIKRFKPQLNVMDWEHEILR